MPVSGKSGAVSGDRLLDLLEPGWRREVAAGAPAADLDVAPDLPVAAARALGEQSRTLSVGGAVERWPACVIVALAHVAAAAGTGSCWQAWHRAAGLRSSKRSVGEWGSAFLAALDALGLPGAGSTADDAVLAHAGTAGREDQNETAGHDQAAGLRLDPFGGGILRVDVLATAVVAAARKLNVQLPIILRLEGTNVEEGRKIIAESGLKVQIGATMKEAADLAVAAAKGVN